MPTTGMVRGRPVRAPVVVSSTIGSPVRAAVSDVRPAESRITGRSTR
jgi:hypothetical protein